MKLVLAIFAVAASAAAQAPQFEVASVKPAATREINGIYTHPGGRITLRGSTLHYMIMEAFDIQPFQVSGGPGWISDDRYDIDAKPPASSKSSQSRPPYEKAPPNDEQRQMLQALLVERFHLTYRRETRDGPVYLLSKMNKPLRMTDAKEKNAYPWAGGLGGGAIMGDGLAGINENMPDLAKRLSRYLGRPVLDQTGLTGSYDFRTEDRSDEQRPDIVTMILTSIQDLGLKLQAARGPIETIVVEQAQRPTAN